MTLPPARGRVPGRIASSRESRCLMQIKRGVAVSPGVVTGEVLVLGTEDFRIPNRFVSIDAVESELGRFRNTLETVSYTHLTLPPIYSV